MRTLEGNLIGTGLRVAVVVSRHNEAVTGRLLAGALDALRRHGVAEDDVTVAWVPGGFELPLAARRLAASGDHDAVVCLGAVVRGETPHWEYIAGEAARGIARVGEETGVPAVFGVLTCDSLDQAVDRAGGKGGNKGAEAVLAAIEMANLLRALPAGAAGARGRRQGPSA